MTLVPTVEMEGHHKLPNGSEIDFDHSRFPPILFGGDQLTVARIRGVQALGDTHPKRVDRFEGLVPVLEDWHARMTVMMVNTMCKLIHMDPRHKYFCRSSLQDNVKYREGNDVPAAQSNPQNKCPK